MHLYRPPKRQRLLNRVYVDWYGFVLQEIEAGKTLPEIARWFTEHDGIPVSPYTISRWMKKRQEARHAA